MLDGLTEPRELQPNPLFIVVKLNFFSCFVIRFLKIFFKLLQNKRISQLFNINFELSFSPFFFDALLISIAFVRLESQRFLFVCTFLEWDDVFFKVIFHLSQKMMSELVLI